MNAIINRVWTMTPVAVLVACAAGLAVGDELDARATWSQPTPMQVRTDVLQWLEGQTLDATEQAQVDALWPEAMPTMSGTELLEQAVATFAIVDPRAAEVVKFCHGRKRKFAAPEFAILQDDATAPLVRGNLKLLFGRWLAQQELFDESLAQLVGVEPSQVVDPASLLFYQSVAYHRALDKEHGLPIIAQLLENEDTLPRRYATVAKLMEADLAPLKADSLDEIARLMDSIRLELEHARAGTRVRKRQDEVIAKLDKLIEELEKQRQQQQQQSASPSGGPPGQPLPDSQNAGGRGTGKVPPKQIGSKADWGNLPPKEREEALQQIGKEFPSHFREVIEEYFHKLARDSEEEMLQLLVTAILAATPVEVDVTTLDDQTYHGELAAMTVDALVLQTGDEKKSLPFASLLRVVPSVVRSAVPVRANVWVELIDGSRLPLEQFTVRSGKAVAALVGGVTLELPVSQLRRVRLLKQDDVVRKLWNDIAAAPLKGDAVVVRKGGDGKPVVLDYLEGVIGDVTDASIAFTLDGDVIQVNRQKVKVEGLLYYRPAAERTAAVYRVDDVRGAAWSAKSLAVSGENIEITTVTGVLHTLPLADVVQFDFSLGKIVSLSDLEPIKSEWQPFLASAKITPGARQMFGLRRDTSFSGKPLMLGETTFRQGLALHSRSEVAFRLPADFTRFVATVGIDPAQRNRGNVRLEIRGDNRVLFDEPIAGRDEPRAIELDIAGVGRLTVLVDYGEGLDIGDQLILGNARLIR